MIWIDDFEKCTSPRNQIQIKEEIERIVLAQSVVLHAALANTPQVSFVFTFARRLQ